MDNLKKMQFFKSMKEKSFEDIHAEYEREILEADADYNKINEIQARYADIFEGKGSEILLANKKVDDTEEVSQCVHFDEQMKDFYTTNLEKLKQIGAIKVVEYTPQCVVCGRECNYLFFIQKNDNVALCWDCADEDTYANSTDSFVCINGGV